MKSMYIEWSSELSSFITETKKVNGIIMHCCLLSTNQCIEMNISLLNDSNLYEIWISICRSLRTSSWQSVKRLPFYILFYTNMVLYRSYYILQRPAGFLILDLDKSIVTTETSLSTAKRFIDMILDSAPSIDAVNEFTTD